MHLNGPNVSGVLENFLSLNSFGFNVFDDFFLSDILIKMKCSRLPIGLAA